MNKLKTLIFITLVIICLFSISCTKYPSFPKELKAYYPYKKNQTVYFHNENGNTMKLHITKIAFSKCHWGYKCTDITQMTFYATAKYSISGYENTYKVDGTIHAEGDYVKFGLCAPVTSNYFANYDSWSSDNVNPYSPDIATIIGDTITMSGAIIVRNEGVVQFKDQNTTWYLTK